ncbi:ABC transporter substrate-binding protein [Paraburkholderia xenovorans]|uniref:ABC transporter substrate-binding protein n=1 Tax=Paraburkholderia xenovorans TaxID=36873 RepID=UPI0038BA5A67
MKKQDHPTRDNGAPHGMTRRTALRRIAQTGASAFALSGGSWLAPGSAQAAAPKPGATIRVASLTPVAAIEPVHLTDPYAVLLINQTGEYLLNDDPARGLVPSLAETWRANADATVWVFTIRRGVKFHDGQTLTARDVVATFSRLADPASGSAALSSFKGVLSKQNIRAVDDYTVEFRLDSANGNFPYYVSSDTYNAIILPANYAGNYERTFIGTGPFRLEKYAPDRASFVRNPDYWGVKALPARIEFTFYADAAAVSLALLGRQVDLVPGVSPANTRLFARDPSIRISRLPSTQHDQVHMRTDQGPFKDKRVRRALALSIDRPRIVTGLLNGYASVGNDHPFSPMYPSSDRTVTQRTQDLREARRLLAEANVPNGFKVTLTTEKLGDIPEFAVLLQNSARQIGIDIDLKIEDQGLYYGSATFGKSDWLDSTLGITDYGHRGVPNLVLNAPLKTGGAWNAAHFANPAYDKLALAYAAAADLASQREVAGKISRLLLDETPLIIGTYRDALTASVSNLAGVQFAAIPQLLLDKAYFA